MDQDVLVTDRVTAGADALRALDAESYRVAAAFWNFFPETEDWRLVLVSPEFRDGRVMPELVKIGHILRRHDVGLSLSDIRLMAADQPLVRALSTFARVSGGEPGRVKGAFSAGVYIEDAYIYRMAL